MRFAFCVGWRAFLVFVFCFSPGPGFANLEGIG